MSLIPQPVRRSRRPSLTPMIDVVFLLLVFFMIAARFGQDMALTMRAAGTSGAYTGPPRLVTISDGGLRLNGIDVDLARLADAVAPLMTKPDDTVVLRPLPGAETQAVVEVLQALHAAGIGTVAVVE